MSAETVVRFPAKPESIAVSSGFEKLWGKNVKSHGYAAIPTIMVRAQHRLGVNPTQFCILVQLLEYWRSPDRAPFPTKQQLADRIGVKQSTIKHNIGALEKAGLIKREQHKTSAGDWGANTYHLDRLVKRIQALEPEFAEEKAKREAARRKVETPKGKRA
jgi:predicted transcriptional regulator